MAAGAIGAVFCAGCVGTDVAGLDAVRVGGAGAFGAAETVAGAFAGACVAVGRGGGDADIPIRMSAARSFARGFPAGAGGCDARVAVAAGALTGFCTGADVCGGLIVFAAGSAGGVLGRTIGAGFDAGAGAETGVGTARGLGVGAATVSGGCASGAAL